MDTYEFDDFEPDAPEPQPDELAEKPRFDWRTFWADRKVLPAFWTVGAGLSLILNLILIVILLIVGTQLFAIKSLVQDQVLGGLYYNFLLMDQANITTTVQVDDMIPVQFDLRLNTDTVVVLTEDTSIENATVTLRTGGLNIVRAPTDIVLPANTELPIHLDLIVPVDTMIPVRLTIPVNIPLDQTDLHEPFVGLQDVVSPYYWLLDSLPDSWGDLFCKFGIGCP